jgi:large subunit ribosomal protein L18
MFRKLKRRKIKKTNYYQRLKLLKSGKLRLVVRKSLNNMLAQIVKYEPKGDKVLVSSMTKELRKYGWLGGNNVCSAYLTGLLIGYKAKKLGINEAILDIGLHRSVKGCKIYALVKGCLDAGLHIPIGEEMLPSEDRILGKHIEKYAKILKEEGKYEKRFSNYKEKGLDAEHISEHVNEVMKKIKEAFGN